MAELLHAESSKQDGNLSLVHESLEVVLPRREAFLSRYGVSSNDCVYTETEHGDKITHVGKSDMGTSISTEALITKDVGVILFLLTADCFPVSFHDRDTQVVALAHMGWSPTDKQLALKVVEEMKRVYGSKPEDIRVIVGPGIHKESYRFVNPIQKQVPEWADYFTDLPDGETEIDLISYIQEQVIRGGAVKENIKIDGTDTATSNNHFSHYRSVRTGELEGRFATIVGLV